MSKFILTLALLSSFSLQVKAADEFEFSFEEETPTKTTTDETEVSFDFDDTFAQEKKGFPLSGKLSLDFGYQTGKPQRWVSLGPYAQLVFDKQTDYGQLYSELTIRNNYAYQIEKDSNAIQKRYELDTIFRELYWKKAFGDTTLTVGKSIVTWGKADLSTVIDIISPIDNSGSLFAKPEEIKIGQNLIKLDWYQANNEFNFIIVPIASNNIQTEAGHPYATALSKNWVDKQKDEGSEWAIRWNQTHDNWEMSVVTGNVHQRDPIIVVTEQTWKSNRVLGAGFNYSQDPFLWKTEILLIKDRPMQKMDFSGSQDKDSFKGMIGFDYAHKNYGNWTVEYSGEKLFSEDKTLVLGEGNKIMAITWSDTFLKDDLSVNTVLMSIGDIKNHLLRTGIGYKLDDDWSISSQLSIITATDSNLLLKSLSNFDRFDLSLNYNFDLSQ
jgi:hypothetical protein